MTGNSIINLGDLSKPVTVFIERVSDAVGGIAKPWQIKRVASAEAQAAKIAALADMEISEIQQRGLQRLVREEGIKQENIESITMKAAESIKEDAKPEELADDWLFHFFEKAKIVSDEDMQTLWSKILAQEVNSPKSYSKKTIEIVSSISKYDALMFRKFCSYVWNIGYLECFLSTNSIKPGGDLDFTFSNLLHLESIGLITMEASSGYANHYTTKYVNWAYYGCGISLILPNEDKNVIPRGNVTLTNAGRELAIISGSLPDGDYLKTALNYLLDNGVTFSTPILSRDKWKAINFK